MTEGRESLLCSESGVHGPTNGRLANHGACDYFGGDQHGYVGGTALPATAD